MEERRQFVGDLLQVVAFSLLGLVGEPELRPGELAVLPQRGGERFARNQYVKP
ncbi:hypothetical protein [Nonomuraea jabiensis]|uniref:hypothetical protein n=1 Tax=Nonomuraea jabiensis TaxID=882448 RepID=UPI003D75CAE5